MSALPDNGDTRDEELLADLFDALLQEILEGRTPDLQAFHRDRPDLRLRIEKTWRLACSVAGRREPSRPVFGGYEILRELGHGGMGTVYLARHQTLQREVAVKVLPQSLAMSPRAKQRFVEEARSLAQIRHDHVVHVHRIVDHTEMLAFEMEFIDGPSLQRLLDALRRHPRPRAIHSIAEQLGLPPTALDTRSSVEWFVRLAIKIARALGEVHRHGLVHRDVKPANILLRKDGTPVLADFGLALPNDLDPKQRKFAGTPHYAAPERLRGEEFDQSALADIYSLGVTLREALTLEVPYRGNSTDEVLRRIEAGRLPTLRSQAPHVSHDLETIVQKAMELDPRHRYATADDFADDLERLLNLEPIAARPAGPLRRAAKFVRRHQKAFVAATGSAALVVAVVWPLAASAAASRAAADRAAAERHRARTLLLCQESLPSWWTTPSAADRHIEQSTRRTLRQTALERALDHYRTALATAPDAPGLANEAAAVRAALAGLGGSSGDVEPLPFRDDPFAAGLHAFLTGERSRHRALWSRLQGSIASDPFVEACNALRIAAEGDPARAYPRIFHAARVFPGASALVVAMAEGAIQAGDLTTARHWFDAIPNDDNDDALGTPRRLLAADLLAAEGHDDEANRIYLEIAREDPSDPRAALRLARLALHRQQLDRAARLYRSLLRRWPDMAPARRALATLALQRRDVAAYLDHVRTTMRRHPTEASELHSLLQLAGLRLRTDNHHSVRTIDRPAAVPLQAWMSPVQVRGIERTLETLGVADRIATAAADLGRSPTGRLAYTLALGALRFFDVTLALPRPVALAALSAPLLLRPFGNRIDPLLTRYQTALGDRFHSFEQRRLFAMTQPQPDVVYGYQVLAVMDLDGDTVADLCVSAPPRGSDGSGFIDLRSAEDGAILQRWTDGSRDRLFALSIADLGDVDGDLSTDILIGSPHRRHDTDPQATVELRSGRTGDPLWTRHGDSMSFGAAVAAVGDVDGDGVRDCVIGVPPLRTGDGGRALICSGADGHTLHELPAPRPDTWFGGAVACAGDVTGDGIDDVLVGGNYGNAAGLVVVFDGRTGRAHLSVNDDNRGKQFGARIECVGDIDRDGHADFAVAAPADGPGTVEVISGHTGRTLIELRGERHGERFGSVLCALPHWRRDRHAALAVATERGGPLGTGYVRMFDLVTGRPLQTVAGPGGRFGYALTAFGDKDGDGWPELGVAYAAPDGSAAMLMTNFTDTLPKPR